MPDRLLTVEQVQEHLHLSRTTTYGLLRSGALPSFKIGPRSRRIAESALEAFIAERMDSTGTAS